MSRKFTFLIISIIGIHSGHSQKTDTIPFELTAYNNIIIDAVLNTEDSLRLMFHTAADGISVTTKALSQLKKKLTTTTTTGKA
ncbi:hypothetical protein [Portibacter marinus]|uniref:hypothetical protein n=1 Tax=Portibacter marinus TaxID=2898660 RepID=UPI001F2D4A1C|nr:hypothetical protein [Portibacter marinus]